MKTRHGMTLIEISLTITLVSIMLLGLFELSQVQRNVVRRLQNNTTALFLLESIKNQIRYELDQGVEITDLHSESLEKLIDSDLWKIELKPQPENRLVVVSLYNAVGGRYRVLYKMEVQQ
ncbi:MAG: prepilin-type N-terminal cleavage/methylation domain-containing protein [Candidatus Riflebacteria bacterium]|nr:prepilin-type N-terminal cleavage/methylation domain-containing protein [Candidatus Riflebacteria bacterium]